MRMVCLFLASTWALSAQNPYTQPYVDSLTQGVEVSQSLLHAAIEQQQIALERERLLFEERQSEMAAQANEGLSYRDAHPNEAQWRINQDVKDAIRACHRAHDDCEKLDGMMLVISKALRPDWTQLTMAEYVECLYAIARNATFAEKARAMLAAQASK